MKKIARLMTLALAVFTMASCEDVPSPYGTVTPPPTPSEVIPTGDGTATNPFNVTAAVAKCKEIGTTESTEKYYVTGVVVTAGAADAQYGNATFVISDEGSTAKFTCFQVLGTDGKKMEEGYSFDVGDVVVVYGPMYNYKGNTPETAGKGAAWVISHNGEPTAKGGTPTPSGDPKGTGTKDDPFNIAAAIAKCVEIGTNPSTEKYYIKGFAVKDATASGGYGNISIDLGDSKDATAIFKAFQVAGTDGEKLADGYKVNTGDEVVVYGPIYNYQGNTPETAGKSAAQIVTINGKSTSESGGGDTPSGETKTVTIAGFLAASVSTDVWYQLTGTIKSLKDGDKYGNFDLEDETGSVYVYGLLSEKGGAKQKFQELVAAQGLQAGTKITIIGNRGEYNGNPQVLNAYFVKVESSGGSGGGGGQSSYSINFKTSGQGEWTINDKTKPAEVEKIWQYDSKYGMKASAFASSTNYASESLLISPKFSLEGASKATLTIKHAINFFASVDAAKTEAQVLVSTDGGTNWTALTLNGWPDKLSWTFFESTADFSAYAGKKDLQIALKYSSTADKAGTWEIESVTIE